MSTNIILNTDSYKISQWKQYPPGTEKIFSYIESRGGEFGSTIFYGLQAFIKEYLLTPITQEDIDEAEIVLTAHGFGKVFNKEGWQYILKEHGGYLPLEIKSVDEGLNIPILNALATIENTDPKCYWLTSYVETAALRAAWYGTTIATLSRSIKENITYWMEKTSDDIDIENTIDFKLHDFGARGVSSFESASIGGSAHLINFKGTDTIAALTHAVKYYNADLDTLGFSIPASEHSTITSWGKERELDSYTNMLDQFAYDHPIIACVSDSYDIYNACKMWGTELKDKIIESGATLVVRPDSGDPMSIVVACLKILGEHFGYSENSKGYNVLPPYIRVIQGDGINRVSINNILNAMEVNKWSASNVNFGMGGALLQKDINRDTLKWAMKCSSAKVNNVWRDVFKDPVTDQGKISKTGRLALFFDKRYNKYFTTTVRHPDIHYNHVINLFKTRYLNGELENEITFEEIRKNVIKKFTK